MINLTGKRALICSNYIPQADIDSFSRRLLHFVEFLREGGWDVTCVANNSAGVDQYAAVLEELGVPVHVGLEEHVERLAGAEHFDVAILGFWYIAEPVMKILRRCSPGTPLIVDSGDLHFLRQARRLLRDPAPDNDLQMLDAKFADETMRELNVYGAADAVFAVSRKEADFVNDIIGDSARAYTVPDCEDLAPSQVPFARRRGLVFIGNFQHQPNGEAVEFLCKEILPQFDPATLVEHPVYIVGNAMPAGVRKLAEGLPFVRMVGWVPSVLPYLERVRVSILPLLHGAGTKRKMIQALAMGTPTVSTTVGAEGFDLRDGEEVLLADDPVTFANAMARLLQDEQLWQRLASQGRARIVVEHGRAEAQRRLLESLAAVLAKPRRPVAARPKNTAAEQMDPQEYREVIRRTQEMVCQTAPPRSTVLVVSRGDEALLNLGERDAWHFPQGRDGGYAGCYPANSAEAITHLETLRNKGGSFLVFPKTAFWWLDHYADFKQHLESRYRIAVREEHSCAIYSLREKAALLPAATEQNGWLQERNGKLVNDPAPPPAQQQSESFDIQAHRPVVVEHESGKSRARSKRLDQPLTSCAALSPGARVLVVGVYLADRANNIDDIVQVLSQSDLFEVTQRWAALGGEPPSQQAAAVTTRKLDQKKAKFEILNELLEHVNLGEFDYVLACDDDIVLPDDFVDHFVSLQAELGFALAQPARTSNSYIDHPIVEQQRGVLARQTLFVEIGPLVSFHKSIHDLVFPFDLTAPMGWGYENVWAYLLAERNMKMGIIDGVPVDHSMRKPVAHYSWHEADAGRTAFWQKHPHLALERCMRVLDVIGIQTAPEWIAEVRA